jgi:hypothetical protein
MTFLVRRRLKLLGIAAVLFGALVFVLGIHDFLVITRPVAGNILAIEGWAWQSPAMREAMDEFNRGQYEWLVTLGARNGGPTEQKSSAELAAGRLRALGVDERRIVVLAVPSSERHQTYTSAVTLKDWLIRSKTEATGVNVFTLGAHARKSLVLFQRALGPRVKVGVIAGTEDTYDQKWWWLSGRGIYVVARKVLGYIYAVSWPFPNYGPF